MATMRVKVKTFTIDEQTIVESVLGNVQSALLNKIGPHLVEVARHRAPVSKAKNFHPRDSSFENLRIVDRSEASFSAEEVSRLRDLRGFGKRELPDVVTTSDIKFFRGIGKNKDRTPDEIRIRRGTIQGAFQHKPGTLRDSIRLDGVTVQGNKVKLVVRAHAPYAWYVHQGRPRPRAPNPFLRSALANIKDEATDGSTYKG